MDKTVQQVMDEFKEDYPNLMSMGLQMFTVFTTPPGEEIIGEVYSARMAQGLSPNDPCPDSGRLPIVVPIVFDHRKAPQTYQGLELQYAVTIDLLSDPSLEVESVPKEFADGMTDALHWDDLFGPERIKAFVRRCPNFIRKRLGQPEITQSEMLDALAFGDFKAHTELCKQLKQERENR